MTREQRANSTLVVRIPGRAKLIEGVEDQIPSHHCQLAQLRCKINQCFVKHDADVTGLNRWGHICQKFMCIKKSHYFPPEYFKYLPVRLGVKACNIN